MAVEREYAVVNEDINLRVEFTWEDNDGNSVYFDPVSFGDVEILDEQNAVEETIVSGSIVKDDVGMYHVVAGPYTEAKKLFDRWTYYTPSGGSVYVHAGWIDVRATEGAALPAILGTAAQTYINVFKKDTKQIFNGVDVYIYDDGDSYVWSGTTDATGRVDPVLEAGAYTVVLSLAGYVFSDNVFSLTITGGEVNRRYLYTIAYQTSFPTVNTIPTDQTCLISFYFGTLSGRPLSNRKVIAESVSALSVTGSQADTIIVPGGAIETITGPFGTCELRAVRGATVTVYVEGTGFSRKVTVPDQATAVFGDLAGEPDLFTMLSLTPPAASVT